MTHLSSYFHDQRLRLGLSLGQAAAVIGFQNLSKGSNRIQNFERTGIASSSLTRSLADVLQIDEETIDLLNDQDREEQIRRWDKWADEPTPMHLIVRWIPSVYCRKPLPAEVQTPAEAEQFASQFAKDQGKKVWLALNRRQTVAFKEDGSISRRTEATPFGGGGLPFSEVGGKRIVF